MTNLEREMGSLEARMQTVESELQAIRSDVREIRDALVSTRGGWKLIMALLAAATSFGAILGKLVPPHFN
jgi:chromosome condensin MukBEF ATPase and DNA-binding subunit MukB